MTALAANRERNTRNIAGQLDGQVTGVDSDEFYEGGLVSWSAAAATIVPSSDTTLERCVGVCIERKTTGSSNTIKVKYEYGIEEWFEHTGLATAQEGDDVYVSDDNIVTDYVGSTNKIRVGIFRELETIKGTAGAWVFLDGMSGVNVGGGNKIAGNGLPVQQWNHAGEGALTLRGADGVSVDGSVTYGGWIPEYDQTITNINPLMGTTAAGTDKVIMIIYDIAGVVLQSSATAGIDTAGADTYLQCPLIAPLKVLGKTEYLVGISLNGTTDGVQRQQTDFRAGTGRAGSQTGVFGTLDPITTVASTFTTALNPLFFAD